MTLLKNHNHEAPVLMALGLCPECDVLREQALAENSHIRAVERPMWDEAERRRGHREEWKSSYPASIRCPGNDGLLDCYFVVGHRGGCRG